MNFAESQHDDAKVRKQLAAAYKNTYMEHCTSLVLTLDSGMMSNPLTHIMCKIGQSSENPETLVRMMEAGMTIAKISCSKGDQKEYARRIANIRTAVDIYGRKYNQVYPLAVALDTQGPELHCGRFKGGLSEIELLTGAKVTLTSEKEHENSGSVDLLYVDYPKMSRYIEPGTAIFVSYGFVKLTVTEVDRKEITCFVECGGKIQSEDLVHLPSNSISKPTLSDKDISDIIFGVEMNIDLLLVAYMRSADNVAQIRDILGDQGQNIKIIASIEDNEGFEKIDEILEVVDGILVARGNLGINLEPPKLYIAQKIALGKCIQAGKPCLIGTQMLKSMLANPIATAAEIADVALAVTEGTSVLILNDETSIGRYPVECVKLMYDICKEAESTMWQRQVYDDLYQQVVPPVDPSTSMCLATVKAAMKLNAAAIVCLTTSGRTARWLAKFRPRCPIIAVTRCGHVARALQIFRAVFPLHYTAPPLPSWQADVDARLQFGINEGKTRGFIKQGAPVFLISGWRHGVGYSNTVRLIYTTHD